MIFDKDGLIKLKAKAGELPVDADEIDDSTSTKKFATAAEKQSISDLKDALKTTTGSGGKGVFVQTTKNQAASHVAVDSTTAKMQAGPTGASLLPCRIAAHGETLTSRAPL